MEQSFREYLVSSDYSEEQIIAAEKFREGAEIFPKDQYNLLIEQRVLIRTRKLKKPRTMYYKDGKVWILNHYFKKYEYIACFPTIE